ADTALLNINLAGSLMVPASNTLNWTGGELDGGSLTVAAGATLTLSNTVYFGYSAGNYVAVTNGGFLTNNGTVIWAATVYGYGGSVISNAGLWQSVTDGTLSSQYGANSFINAGTLQKIGGAGTSTISW